MFWPISLLFLSLAGLGAALTLPGWSDLVMIAGPSAFASLYLLLRALRGPSGTAVPVVVDGSNVMYWRDGTPQFETLIEVLARIRAEAPHVPLTIWRDEDTALLWPEILRTVSGHSPDIELTGWFAWYWDLMSPQSHEALRRWFQTNPSPDDLHRRKVLSAMLDKFALPEKIDTDAALLKRLRKRVRSAG